jgi:hypothetical protein
VVHKVVSPAAARLSKRELNAHAEQIAEGNRGSAAVRRAIDDMMAAVIATMTVATAAASSS